MKRQRVFIFKKKKFGLNFLIQKIHALVKIWYESQFRNKSVPKGLTARLG